MVGVEIADVTGGHEVRTRFGQVAAAAGVAFAARYVLVLLRHGRHGPVLVGAGAIAALLIGVLAVEWATGQRTIGRYLLPFENPVMDWVLAAIALFLFGRAAQLRRLEGRTASATEASEARWGDRGRWLIRWLGPAFFGFGLVFPFLFFIAPDIVDRRMLDIAVLVLTYIMLGWGLNIVVGLAGLLDLGYVAFFAVGAYSYALLADNFSLGFWICLPFAGIMSAFAGILLGFPVLRLRGDYLAIVTLGFGEMIRIILLNWQAFTGGPNGLSGIPRPTLFGIPFEEPDEDKLTFHGLLGLEFDTSHRIVFMYFLIFALAMLTNAFTQRIRRLPVGRAWEALREDEIASRSLGINPTNTKLTAFAIGAMFAGFAGSFAGTRLGFIAPEMFTFLESAVIVAIVVLGGFGSQLGVVLAAILLIGLPEVFRELKDFRMVAFGLAMVGIMLWRPSGLISHRDPTIRLHPAGRGGGS
ncbi:MAG: high-affinity branched-chain amino acid ABC transporter permease LivM [Alphaproteobacteria bacterium]|nr:high-affinity branched-chain amino acid ABC transporter permease LivM [Alphaproteobacteria bacterium]